MPRFAMLMIAFALMAFAPHSTPSLLAEVPSSWDCLPEETVFAVRIPNGKAIKDSLGETTKLGKVFLSDERIEKIKDLIVKQGGNDLESFRKKLSEYGLSPEDFPKMLAGESGLGIVLEPREEADPFGAMLAWLEPGKDLAERAYSAVEKAVEDSNQDENSSIIRIDMEIEGQPVLQLGFPNQTYDYSDVKYD
ncbi:MAG: hypothetical protein N2C12_11275, partial [Planctomycetales bacterium]